MEMEIFHMPDLRHGTVCQDTSETHRPGTF